jgi:hypothetical protein
LPLSSASVRSSMDFFASSSKAKEEGAEKVRTPKAGAAGANAEAAGMARRATTALMSFIVCNISASELQKIVSNAESHFIRHPLFLFPFLFEFHNSNAWRWCVVEISQANELCRRWRTLTIEDDDVLSMSEEKRSFSTEIHIGIHRCTSVTDTHKKSLTLSEDHLPLCLAPVFSSRSQN